MVEYYSVTQSEVLVDVTISINFENMLCERINPWKNTYYMIPPI